MTKIKDLIEKLLKNPPNCKQCGALMVPVDKGIIYESDKPVGYIIIFRCPECRAVTVAIVQIKIIARNSLRASLFLFETIY